MEVWFFLYWWFRWRTTSAKVMAVAMETFKAAIRAMGMRACWSTWGAKWGCMPLFSLPNNRAVGRVKLF